MGKQSLTLVVLFYPSLPSSYETGAPTKLGAGLDSSKAQHLPVPNPLPALGLQEYVAVLGFYVGSEVRPLSLHSQCPYLVGHLPSHNYCISTINPFFLLLNMYFLIMSMHVYLRT